MAQMTPKETQPTNITNGNQNYIY